ncbi:MAG: hypothetical protein IM563_05120 [Chitinophagaceae bacterium]|nr:hypothetical protein [Chitinophagaceae bacterium]MCA6481207.1 hypothetical protein [Chitinophagaceae bacterium]MCA6481622.1 hypothetical protein [Chitinophagaceae bacterium]MCA6511974.1 hypothetical protein [Chitinophagaceae bacterium]
MSRTIDIRPMALKSSDERGSVHHFTTQRSGEYMVFYRRKGAIGARHYHKGLSANKNPEQFVLLNGTATLNWKDLRSGDEGSIVLESPVEVDIYPWIWHEVVAETDFVMLELNSMLEGPLDTFYIEKDQVSSK